MQKTKTNKSNKTKTKKPNTHVITCMPSRISTFFGTAEDLLNRIKHKSVKNIALTCEEKVRNFKRKIN